MAHPQEQALLALQRGFVAGSERWPGLHHAFIQLDTKEADDKFCETNFFLESYAKTILMPLMGGRRIVTCNVSLADSLASERQSLSVYFDDPPGDVSALRLFQELALSANRILFPDRVAGFENAYAHGSFWPDAWIGLVYTLGQELKDPLLHVREHRLEVGEDGKSLLLTPGYSVSIPEGCVTGMGGRSRPWTELLCDLARYGVYVDVLEAGVFRASARALDPVLRSKKAMKTLLRRSKVGRPHDPRVAERNHALVEEYKRTGNDNWDKIAASIAPKFRDLPCGPDQARKAVRTAMALEKSPQASAVKP